VTMPASHDPEPRPSRARTYVLVLVLHAAVITALWTFGRYFSS
jgi:hypothetical protein